MTLTQLKYFCEVAKTRHFTAAANNLYIAQSSLSYAIHELEEELNVPLFFRRPNKKIDLTNYGTALLPYAEAGLKMLEDGRNEVESMRSPLSGNVKIGLFYSVALNTMPLLVRRFMADNPDNHINFDFEVNHNWADMRDMLLRGQFDLVISASNITSNCESVPIAKQRLVLIVANNHPLAVRDSIHLSDLAHEKLIANDVNSNLDSLVKDMFKAEGMVPQITYLSDWTSQQVCVALGKGVAVSINLPVDESVLRKIPIEHPMAELPLYLTWPSNRSLSQASEYVRDYFVRLPEVAAPEDLLF